jgi:selenoprotein S
MDADVDQDVPYIENENPQVVRDTYYTVTSFLSEYGWFVIVAVVIVIYFKNYLTRWWSAHSEYNDLHRYDDSAILSRHNALEQSRRRMQERFDMQAAQFAEQQKQREEEKRQRKLEEWDRKLSGRRPPDTQSNSQSSVSSQKKKRVYRTDDYNPLSSGSSSSNSCSFRPSSRRGAGG